MNFFAGPGVLEPPDLAWQVGMPRELAQIASAMGLSVEHLRSLVRRARVVMVQTPISVVDCRVRVRRAVDELPAAEFDRLDTETLGAHLTGRFLFVGAPHRSEGAFAKLSRSDLGLIRLTLAPFPEEAGWWQPLFRSLRAHEAVGTCDEVGSFVSETR